MFAIEEVQQICRGLHDLIHQLFDDVGHVDELQEMIRRQRGTVAGEHGTGFVTIGILVVDHVDVCVNSLEVRGFGLVHHAESRADFQLWMREACHHDLKRDVQKVRSPTTIHLSGLGEEL